MKDVLVTVWQKARCRSFGPIYPQFTSSDNQRRNLVWDLGRCWCSAQIIWWCEEFTDPILNRQNCSQTHQGRPNNYKHVWCLGFKIWMIASLLSEQDHNSQWERQVCKEIEVNERTFEMTTVKKQQQRAVVQVRWTAEMEERLVDM